MKLQYAVVFEQTPNNYCAYAPDVPGCISTGKTWLEIQQMMREALTFHIEFILEQGEPLPEPKISIEDAIAFNDEPVEDYVLESYAEHGEPLPSLSTTVEMVEIEVKLPATAAGS